MQQKLKNNPVALAFGATAPEWDSLIRYAPPADLLPVVSDPGAVIAEYSTLKKVGKTPSEYTHDGKVRGIAKWTQLQATDRQIAHWRTQPNYGVCIQTRFVRGIDVDVEDAQTAQGIYKALMSWFKGQGLVSPPVRSRVGSERFLVMFALEDETLGKTVIPVPRFGSAQERPAIEILMRGQQFVAAGTHPSGVRYELTGLDRPIPELTLDQFNKLFAFLVTTFGGGADLQPGKVTPRPTGADLDLTDPAVAFMHEHDRVYAVPPAGHLVVDCPNAAEHTDDSDGTDATVYIPAGKKGQAKPGFKCLHAHCAALGFADYYRAIGYAEPHGFESLPDDTTGEPKSKGFSFKDFSLKGESSIMRKNLLAEAYVLGRIAQRGQHTVFYSKPNGGKTLLTIHMLIEAIKAGQIDPDCVHYINVDDNARGFLTKLEIAEQYGFNMMREDERGFKCNDLPKYIDRIIADDTARGQILILDTVKKFTDLMDKKKSSDFGHVVRRFVMAGGTVISLGHVNKHKNAAGRSVAAGTTDLTDDADAKYLLEVMAGPDNWFTTTFDASVAAEGKTRGGNDLVVSYKYQRIPGREDYAGLLASVTRVGSAEAKAAREVSEKLESLEKNRGVIDAIYGAIEAGTAQRTELIKAVQAQMCFSRDKIRQALDLHTGEDFAGGDRWNAVNVLKLNVTKYVLLEPTGMD